MANLIRRNKAIPVEARRTPMPPDTVVIPGGPATPTPNVAAGGATSTTTHNIFYVNVPQGQPAAPASATVDQRPQEHHYHTTNVYVAGPRRRRIGTSFLGKLAFVAGGLAAGAAYVQPIMSLAKPIALFGVACGGLGLLGAILLGRVGKAMPVLGLIACGIGYGLFLRNSGQLPSEFDRLRSRLPQVDFFNVTPGTTAPPAAPASATPASIKPVDHSIFGDGGSGWTKPADPIPTDNPAAVIPTTTIDPTIAKANLEAAREAAARRMGLDYIGAKSVAADALTKYQQAKASDTLGNPELIQASQQNLEADSQLRAIESKLRADPAVAAAEKK